MSASIHLFDEATIRPLAAWGFTHPFWSLHIEILMASWIGMLLILGLALLGRYFLDKEFNLVASAYEKIIDIFVDLSNDSFGSFRFNYFVFILAIFSFTFFSCLVGVIPFVEEATKDLNTTVAIALTSFFYVQYQKINLHGIKGFLKEFIEPFFVLAPLHVVGELSKITSMSLRLFGNILGGGIIVSLLFQLLGHYQNILAPAIFIVVTLSILFRFVIPNQHHPALVIINRIINVVLNIFFLVAWVQIFLGIFEGLIQSFVLTMLTTTYLAMNLHHSSNEHTEGAV